MGVSSNSNVWAVGLAVRAPQPKNISGEHFIHDYNHIDDDEQAILSVYRASNDVGKRIILRSVDSFKDVPELNDKISN